MADRLEVYEVTVAPGVTKAAPQSTPLTFDPGYLRRWQVIVPDGVAGLAGFAFAYAGQQLIPNTKGAYLTGNDEPLGDEVHYHFTGDQWVLLTYNTGGWPHTFRVRLYVDEISGAETQVTTVDEVLPVTINAGTVDLTPAGVAPLDFGADTTVPIEGDVTPLDIAPDAAPADLTGDVTPLDLPPDAPVVADDTAGTDTTEADSA